MVANGPTTCQPDLLLYGSPPGRLGASVSALADRYGTALVFVMAHPKVREVVKHRLQDHGLEPVFMELEDAEALLAQQGGACQGRLCCVRTHERGDPAPALEVFMLSRCHLAHCIPPPNKPNCIGGHPQLHMQHMQ